MKGKTTKIQKSAYNTRATVPQQAIKEYGLKLGQYIDWIVKQNQLQGIPTLRETPTTTQITRQKKNQWIVEILPFYVRKYNIQKGQNVFWRWNKKRFEAIIDLKQ